MSLRLAVLGGSGKTGSSVVRIAQSDGDFCEIQSLARGSKFIFDETDLIIDFSSPESTHNLLQELPNATETRSDRPAIVIGTTGLAEATEELMRSLSLSLPIFYSANFSIGIALLDKFLRENAKILQENYGIKLHETHRLGKVDTPSGTALRLASNFTGECAVTSTRESDIFGIHLITMSSVGEKLEFRHTANSREVFAEGAIRAGKWLIRNGKKHGLFGMTDLLKLHV